MHALSCDIINESLGMILLFTKVETCILVYYNGYVG